MRVRQYIFVGAVLAVLAAVLVHTLSEERIQVYFDRVEAIPGYKIELREQPLRIAMISVLNHQTTDEYQHAMVRSIGRLLGRPVLLLHRRSYAEINQLLARGDADVAFLSSGAYMVYGKKEDVRLLAMPERDGANRYFSYIIVPRGSPAQALSDLRGRRFVYVDPLSYSGYIELRARLRAMGEDPEHFFGSIILPSLIQFNFPKQASLGRLVLPQEARFSIRAAHPLRRLTSRCFILLSV